MKRMFIILILVLTICITVSAQGRYAGTMNKMPGKTYSDIKQVNGLTGWQYREGSLLTAVDDTQVMTADVFKKGTTYIILFSIKEDTADTKFTIADVIEVKNVLSTQHIRTGVCWEGANEAVDIVALVKKENNIEYSRAIKAWRLNRDKKRAELISPKLVKCMNELD